MNDSSEAADMMASPVGVKPPRKTNWGLSPIASPLKGKINDKRRQSKAIMGAKPAKAAELVVIKVNRSLSQSSFRCVRGAHLHLSPPPY